MAKRQSAARKKKGNSADKVGLFYRIAVETKERFGNWCDARDLKRDAEAQHALELWMESPAELREAVKLKALDSAYWRQYRAGWQNVLREREAAPGDEPDKG